MNSCMLVIVAFVALVVFIVGFLLNPILTSIAALVVVAIFAVVIFGGVCVALMRGFVHLVILAIRKARGE